MHLSSLRAAAAAAVVEVAACLGSAGGIVHHNDTPAEGAGDLGAPHSMDHYIAANFDNADLDSSPADHTQHHSRYNPAGTHTGHHNHYTAAAAADGAGADVAGAAFAAQEVLAIWDLVADRSRTAVEAAAVAGSDAAVEDSRE